MSTLQSSLCLLSIPPEIRLCIYPYLIQTSVFRFKSPGSTSGPSKLQLCPCDPGISIRLLLVCRLIHQEARSVLYLNNPFQFLHPLPSLDTSPLLASSLSLLRTVIIGPFQCTARKASLDIAATCGFLRSSCPGLETLSCRHWLVKHVGADIDEEQDFAPILDTTYYFDLADSSLEKEPLRYSMGILTFKKAKMRSNKGQTTPADIYTVLCPKLLSGNQRATLLENWARISTKCLLNLVGSSEGKEIAFDHVLRGLSTEVFVDSVIEMNWRSAADELLTDTGLAAVLGSE